MISRADFDAYSRAVDAIVGAASSEARGQILAWCAAHPGASVAEVRDAAIEIVGGLAQVYDEAAASLAADRYDGRASEAGARLPEAITETTFSIDLVERVVRYQARKLVEGDVGAFASACGELLENDARRSLNATVIANAARDRSRGVRFARVPTGAETCSFCYMLASRGAVYHTRETAGSLGQYHRHCDCKIVPGFEDDPFAEIVEGYDPLAMRERMATMERETGLRFGDDSGQMSALTADMRLRDPGWLTFGREPEVGYADETVRAKKVAERGHAAELATAERLRAHGYRVTFVDDAVLELDPSTGQKRLRGLPDLDTGLEIKSVRSATSENTISKHIANAKGKRGLSQVVIDVSENPGLSDAEARAMVTRSLRRHGMASAMLLRHDGGLETVRPEP